MQEGKWTWHLSEISVADLMESQGFKNVWNFLIRDIYINWSNKQDDTINTSYDLNESRVIKNDYQIRMSLNFE